MEVTAAEQGADAIAIPIRRQIALSSDLVSFVRLWRMLRRVQPDLTEFSSPKAGLLGTVAAMLAGVPVRIYMLRGFRLDHTTGLKRRILLAAERVAAACAHIVLCNSESMLAEAEAMHVAAPAKLKLLGNGSSNGVSLARFSPGVSHIRDQLGFASDAPVIGFVGRITRDKGVPELVEAFASILRAEPRAHLLLVGWFDEAEDALDGHLRTYIRDQPRIHLTGFVKDTVPYYRAMDLLVLPSWREGFPNVVLEAGATGIPAITTESTGSRDSVVPEVTGLLIPPGNPEMIEKAVLTLLRDPVRRRKMGEAARAWVAEHYSDTRVLGLTAEFYKSLLREKMHGRNDRR